MKHPIPLLTAAAALLAMAACTSSDNLSRSEFDKRTTAVENAMARRGYHPVAFNADIVNEGHPDGDKWQDDYVWYDRRSFADSLGNRAEYTMRYRKVGNRILQLDLTSCAVSNGYAYSSVCGPYGAVGSNIPGR